jgi:rhamnosyltransferase
MEGSKTLSVGVVIVTLNAEREVEPALRAVLGSSVVSRCLVMDSSSTDGTVALAKRLGAEVHILPRAEFNHGATREKARKLLATDIVVLLTQDVIPEADFIAELIKPIRCGETVAAYSRQLPHLGAEFFEAFPP